MLTIGGKATVDGPYGRFSYQLYPARDGIIMIAGGIGITPMLSMIQTMAARGDDCRVTLIWCNRRPLDIVFAETMDDLARRLPDLHIIHHFSRETADGSPARRLDDSRLDDYLAACSKLATIFICGPPVMMDDVRKMLSRLGFCQRRMHTEEFSL